VSSLFGCNEYQRQLNSALILDRAFDVCACVELRGSANAQVATTVWARGDHNISQGNCSRRSHSEEVFAHLSRCPRYLAVKVNDARSGISVHLAGPH